MNRTFFLVACALLLLVSLATDVAQADDGAPRYARAVEANGHLALDIAIREMVDVDGDGPDIWLVGVIHVGDGSYYRSLQSLLDLYPAVLYESVMPPGAGRLRTGTADERIADTRARLDFLAMLVAGVVAQGRDAPAGFDALAAAAASRDARLGHFVERSRLDAWGGAIRYEATDGADAAATWRVRSLGSDGVEGGEGEAADLEVDVEHLAQAAEARRRSSFDLQVRLAALLGLVHQGDGVRYDRSGWQPSDMAFDELRRAVAARGGSLDQIEALLDGKGFTGAMIRVAVGLLETANRFTGGRVREAVKAMMIQTLGDPDPERQAGGGFDEAVEGAIIDDRNTVVLEDLARLAAERPELSRVAVFYGAGHMPDLETRLEERGYRPGRTRWLRAMRADLKRAGSFGEALREGVEQAADAEAS